MIVTIFDVNQLALLPHQTHSMLSMREGEMITASITMMLADSRCMDVQTLKYVARFYPLEDYKKLVFIRNSHNKCGYPLCDKNLNRNRMVDLETCGSMLSYCNTLHYDCSNYVLSQLSDVAVYQRDAIHLINTYDLNKVNEANCKYQIQVMEELLQDKITEHDLDSMTDELTNFQLKL